jgi:mRNA-degrading endonuclease RelE of RelBE toxin-antitoxin system
MKISTSDDLEQTMLKLKKNFKNLRRGMSDYKRVHIGKFVLFFKVEKDVIIFDRFVHHDEAY